MKKIDFINSIKEDINNQQKTPLGFIPSDKEIADAGVRVQKVKQLTDQLKSFGLGEGDMDESFEINKEYKTSDEFFKDLIDHLLFKNFKVTYFEPKEGAGEPLSQNGNQNNQISGSNNLSGIVKMIQNALNIQSTEGNVSPLYRPYIALRNLDSNKMNENNLINSDIFSIIAEAESPKITKGEIENFISNKRNEYKRS
jgi:hypothetical protein